MTTTITTGSLSFSPTLTLGWTAAQTTRNIMHNVIGKADPDVTLRPAQTRTGTLELFFALPATAELARTILATGTVFVITSTEATWLDGLRFVIAGDISATLEDETRAAWMLSADFQEVLP